MFNELREVLIVSGDYIGEKLQSIESSISNKMDALQNENIELQKFQQDTVSKLESIISLISNLNSKTEKSFQNVLETIKGFNASTPNFDSVNKSISNLLNALNEVNNQIVSLRNDNKKYANAIYSEMKKINSAIQSSDEKTDGNLSSVLEQLKTLKTIIPDLKTELDKLPGILNQNITQIQDKTIQNFENEIIKFTDTVKAISDNLNKTSQEQRDALQKIADSTSKIAGNVQGILTKGVNDLESKFGNVNEKLEGIILDNTKKLKSEYQKNIEIMLQNIADNLASIIRNNLK